MIIGIVGSRRRNSPKDFGKLILRLRELERETERLIEKIVTGDCDEGGDEFASEIADMFGYEIDVKHKRDPETNQIIPDYINERKHYDYFTFCNICYARNEEIAKEPLDYLIAIVAPDRTGGTEKTIKHFKRLHKDWKEKLIIL